MLVGGCCGVNQVSLGIELVVWCYTWMLSLLCDLISACRFRFVAFGSHSVVYNSLLCLSSVQFTRG